MRRQLQFLGLPQKPDDVDLKKHLFDNGYGVIDAIQKVNEQKTWMLDSITFLAKNKAVCGMLCKLDEKKWHSVRIGAECVWCTSLGSKKMNAYDSIEKAMECEQAFVIWKMWIPVARALQFGHGDIHITTTAMGDTERIELERTSAYMPLVNNFKDNKACVHAQMRKWKSSVLMSNSAGVVLCRPTRNGFRGEKLMSVECLNQYRQSERMFDTFVKRIQIIAESRPESKVKIYNMAAHALHSACKVLNIPIKSNDFSMFNEEELKLLLDYDKHLEKSSKEFNAAERDMEKAAQQAEEEEMEKKMAKVSVAPRRPSTPPMERRQPPPRVDGPRDAAWLAKEREARKQRMQRLQT